MLKYITTYIISTLLLSSCASALMVGDAYPAKPLDAKIDVYLTKKPTGNYSEIAIIKCEDITNNAALNRIKKKARTLGADAIIITGPAETSTSVSSYSFNSGFNYGVASSYDSGFAAVAIKYTE